MSEFEDKLNSVLSDPAQMEKIASLAASLMGGGTEGGKEGASAPDAGIFERLGSLFGTGKDSGAAAGVDDGTLRRLTSALASRGSDKTALCAALAPYLSPARRDKLNKAVRFAHLASIAGVMLREGGDGKNV